MNCVAIGGAFSFQGFIMTTRSNGNGNRAHTHTVYFEEYSVRNGWTKRQFQCSEKMLPDHMRILHRSQRNGLVRNIRFEMK
jgi:hypothetical protein